MESERGKAVILSDEEDEETETLNLPTNKRMYDCIFCKRGFTNAQALGGHMNIHRRDRARPPKKTATKTPPSSSSFSYNNITHHAASDHRHVVYQPPYDDGVVIASSNGQDLAGVDLSLGLGSVHERGMRRGEGDDNVDLELRLGHHYR